MAASLSDIPIPKQLVERLMDAAGKRFRRETDNLRKFFSGKPMPMPTGVKRPFAPKCEPDAVVQERP